MPGNPPELAGSRFARRMALFYASTFVALGVHLPFLPVWLAAKGLDPETIGVVLAMPMILRLFAIPPATREADRRDALRAVVMAATLAALIGFGTLAFTTGTLVIAVLYTLSATAFMLLFVLSDVYALRGLAPHRRAYGPVRLWGSAAFIVANVAADHLLDVIAARELIWLIVAAVAICLAVVTALPPLATRPPGTPGETPPARVLLRDPAFIMVAVGASLIQGSHALYYSFSTIDWQAAGFSGGTIGVLWALGVLAEIVLFALSTRLPAAFTPSILILIGRCGRAGAVDRDGAWPTRRAAAAAAMPARPVVWGHASRHAGLHRTRRAGRARGDRAGLSRGLSRCRDGGCDGIVRPAVRAVRRRGLWRDGVHRCRRPRRRGDGASRAGERTSMSMDPKSFRLFGSDHATT
jgi:MFS transporter, PPP family, 3-phenylpropionic acid transporter